MHTENNNKEILISADRNPIRFEWKEIWNYRDLMILFVRRDLVSTYKQTILGPLWFFLQPLLTMVVFTFVFSYVANISTNGLPPMLFYLSGIILWNYFADCLTATANTFQLNAAVFGKVYFPRVIVPLSRVLSGLVRFGIQFFLLLVVWLYYLSMGQVKLSLDWTVLFIPLFVIQMLVLGLGLGMVVSSLTIKYRDLSYLITFGVQLLMYASPVVYPLSQFSPDSKLYKIIALNPVTPVIEGFRGSLLGTSLPPADMVIGSVVFSLIALLGGVIVFNRVERSFIDVV